MDGMSPQILLILMVIGMGYYAAKPVVHVAKKIPHAIVHVVTLGKK